MVARRRSGPKPEHGLQQAKRPRSLCFSRRALRNLMVRSGQSWHGSAGDHRAFLRICVKGCGLAPSSCFHSEVIWPSFVLSSERTEIATQSTMRSKRLIQRSNAKAARLFKSIPMAARAGCQANRARLFNLIGLAPTLSSEYSERLSTSTDCDHSPRTGATSDRSLRVPWSRIPIS